MVRFAILFVVMFAPFWAHAQGRVALLVGNAQYDDPALVLANPANDVAALQRALEDLDFQVFPVVDQDRAGVTAALDAFADAAKNADMAVFFFAGHGVQINGENHFITREFNGTTLANLADASVSLTQVREAFASAAPKIGILILDACRNNPFVESGQAAQGLARSAGGAGLLIAYATDPGNVAYDGQGENSVFTTAIIDHIATPGLDARIMFGRVRQQVILQTRGEQIPWVEEAVLGEHYFAGRLGVAMAGAGSAVEMQKWREISAQTEIEPFVDYIAQFPDGVFTQFARDRIAMIRQARAAGAPSGRSSAEILAAEDPVRVKAALQVLGFAQQSRGLTLITISDLASAFDLYRVQLPNPDEASADRLYQDAARMTVFLGATTASQIRKDIAVLDSISRTMDLATNAAAEIAEIAQTNDAAIPVLEQAQRDIADIQGSLDRVMARLDQTRDYYQQLIDRAQNTFPDRVDSGLLETLVRGNGLNPIEQTLAQNAALFVKHVQAFDPETRGSFAWMIDFLPGNG